MTIINSFFSAFGYYIDNELLSIRYVTLMCYLLLQFDYLTVKLKIERLKYMLHYIIVNSRSGTANNSANSDIWLRHAGRNRCRKMPAMEGRQIVNCPFFDAETISEHQKGSS